MDPRKIERLKQIERRQAPRAKRVLTIQFRIVRSKAKEFERSWHLSTTENMSILGLAFLSDMEAQPGDILEIHVVMSGVLDIFNGYSEVVRLERKKSVPYNLIAVKFLENFVLNKRPAKKYVAGP